MDVSRGSRLRQFLPYLAAGAAAVAVLVVILLPSHHTPSLNDRTHQVAAQLRCPTCAGESAADSTSPMAESMRAEIQRQLAAGRSEDQVLAWFRSRYGNSIVLAPPRAGLGWVFWAAPPMAALAVLGGVVLVRRRSAGPVDAGAASSTPPTPSTPAAPSAPSAPAATPLPSRRLPAVLAVAVAAAVAVPVLVHHGESQESSATASAPASAAASAQTDPVGEAFALLRSGHPTEAEQIVRGLAHKPGKERPLALLVLGLAERAEGQPAALATLREFVRRYPHHPASAQVRRLLAGSG